MFVDVSMWAKVGARVLALLVVVGCRAESPGTTGERPPARSDRREAAEAAPTAPPPVSVPTRPTRFPPADRVVGIGDVHGDLDATRRALRLAGAIDETDRWVGGALVVVQTGDQLDRGDDEREILDLLERLVVEAEAAGGALHVLNGNHEIMNAVGDLRYVTPDGFRDFEDFADLPLDEHLLEQLPRAARPRAAAFRPGAPYAQVLARRNTVVIVGDTVFAHGGVLPAHARRLDAINHETRAWLAGAPAMQAGIAMELMDHTSVVWTRAYGDAVDASTCETLEETLRILGVSRMVVGHTVQKEGITSACDEKVWRIDVGMAKHYGGSPAVLVIEDGKATVVTEG